MTKRPILTADDRAAALFRQHRPHPRSGVAKLRSLPITGSSWIIVLPGAKSKGPVSDIRSGVSENGAEWHTRQGRVEK